MDKRARKGGSFRCSKTQFTLLHQHASLLNHSRDDDQEFIRKECELHYHLRPFIWLIGGYFGLSKGCRQAAPGLSELERVERQRCALPGGEKPKPKFGPISW